MKLIAHRGLTNGPNIQIENRPDTIHKALSQGYDVEIDLWAVDNKLYLGHDSPTYEIPHDFLVTDRLWIHAKNLQALTYLSQTNFVYFWHQNDDYTLTSNGYIWTYIGKELSNRSIMLLPEVHDTQLNNARNVDCYAICSDYVETIRGFYE